MKFFGYLCERDKKGKLKLFNQEKIEIDDFRKLSYQMVKVPVKIIDKVNKKEFNGKYEVGFIGCDKNDKNEVFHVKGWIFSILNKKQNVKENVEENVKENVEENVEEKEEEKEENVEEKEEKKDEKDESEEDDDDDEEEEKVSNEEELREMYREMEEDEDKDKYDSINDYYL